MPLRFKFFISFLVISFFPLTIAGLFTFRISESEVTKRVISQLQAVASAQEIYVYKALTQYLKQIKFVTSHPKLITAISTNNQLEFAKVFSEITNTKVHISVIDQISIIDMNGMVITSSDVQKIGQDYKTKKVFQLGQKDHILYDMFKNEQNTLKVSLAGPVVVNNQVVAVTEIIVNATPLIAATRDYTGLGDTGEAYFIKKKDNTVFFLTPLRFDPDAALMRTISDNKTIFTSTEQEQIFINKNTIDYRNAHVLAVTRFIDALGWKLVVKIDRTEALEPINALVRAYFLITIVSILLVTLISFLVARAITKPIYALTELAQNLQSGNFDKRSQIKSKDEIGFLATTFNDMAIKLEEVYQKLEEKVQNRTVQLQEISAKDEAILASLGDGLIVTDKQGRITLANPAFEKLLMHNKKEAIGEKLTALIPMLDEHNIIILEHERPITQVLLTQATVTLTTNKYQKKDGSVFPVAITIAPIMLEKNIIGTVEIFRDITKEKEVDRAKTEFVSLASHQLRTPLSIINWYTEMLLTDDAGETTSEQKKYLKEICQSNQRMVELVNALLNVSRLELGTLIAKSRPADIVVVIKSIVKNLETKIANQKLNLQENYNTIIEKINIDTELVSMALENILINAIKYTPAGGTITLSVCVKNNTSSINAKLQTTGLSSVLIIISDTGYGIPKNQQDKIFSKLFRADNIKEYDSEGTGLGLYIAKTIINLSNGKIWFKSEEGKGTTFFIEFPIV